jgi:hypothetical protein
MTISAEARFVGLCVREPDALRPGALRRAADAVRDWPAVVTLAGEHRVAAFVRDAGAGLAGGIPGDAERTLRRQGLETAARVMRLDAELIRIGSAFAAAGLPLIVLKGPGLARTIYARQELRPYNDLDLTVRDADGDTATALLLRHGLREIEYEAETARQAHAGDLDDGAAFHRQFVLEPEQVLVELHLDPLQLGLRPLCEADRWRRALPIPGVPGAAMLSAEDQLVQLSVHAHKHGFARLIWLKDIDLLLRAHGPRLDWRVVRRVAEREGVRSSVWYTLVLARRLLAAPAPRPQIDRLAPSAPVRMLYRRLWPVARIAGLDGYMRRRAVQFHAAESWRGMLPSLIVMGRRRTRLRTILRHLAGR